MMWLLYGISNVPTLNVYADVWDCVESYTIHMLLAHRLKIIPKSNLKLIISFLVLHILLLSLFKSLSLVAATQHARLTSRIVLRLANRPSAQFANSSKQGQTPSNGDQICPFSSQGKGLVLQVSRCGAYLEPKVTLLFLQLFAQCKKTRKFLPTFYLWGPNFNGSSAKLHVVLSRNW